jgi:hypothetical protein
MDIWTTSCLSWLYPMQLALIPIRGLRIWAHVFDRNQPSLAHSPTRNAPQKVCPVECGHISPYARGQSTFFGPSLWPVTHSEAYPLTVDWAGFMGDSQFLLHTCRLFFQLIVSLGILSPADVENHCNIRVNARLEGNSRIFPRTPSVLSSLYRFHFWCWDLLYFKGTESRDKFQNVCQ